VSPNSRFYRDAVVFDRVREELLPRWRGAKTAVMRGRDTW
jgi:hypothetical protein